MNNRSLPQIVALTFGAIYLLVGVLGLIPFFGGSYTQTSSDLLGFVPINLLHNIVHLVIGVAGLAAASSMSRSRLFAQVFGSVLLLVGLLGIVTSNPLSLIPIGGVDIAIHLLTGAVLAYVGFASPVAVRRAA